MECDKFTGKDQKCLVRDLHNKIRGVHVQHPLQQTAKVNCSNLKSSANKIKESIFYPIFHSIAQQSM